MISKSFYPTPVSLISKMVSKIQGHPKLALDPSAGKGDLIEGCLNSYKFSQYNKPDFSAIEINETLQATLHGKGIKLIDSDFLKYSAPDKFDLLIMNPPFEDGDKHLHKALDIMYRGQIVCLLNAETIKNPYSNIRKTLVERLTDLKATIDYIPDAFLDAERRTGVEVALVYVKIDRKVEEDLFSDCDDTAYHKAESVTDKHEVSTGKTIFELVADYNDVIRVGQETILNYYRNIRKIGNYLTLGQTDSRDLNRYKSAEDLTTTMQDTLNTLLSDVRKTYWRKTLDLKEVRSRMTAKKASEFEIVMQARSNMDFTESNIRQFVLNLIGGYEQTLIDAVIDLFDRFTIRHAWDENLHTKNIHYFSGWKTNDAFKVGKRVIIPVSGGYGNPFTGYSNQWEIDYRASESLRDIDLVMSYFDGMKDHISISDALKESFKQQENNTESTYFKIIAHKKGTIHLTFKDEDILRRFNVVACRGKGWLPHDYNSKPFKQLTSEEQQIVESFEDDIKTYDANITKPLFAIQQSGLQQLVYIPDAPIRKSNIHRRKRTGGLQ